MNLSTLILVNTSTLLIFIVSLYLFFKLFKRYKKNIAFPTLFLALYSLSLAILYVFVFMLRFPTEEMNLATKTIVVPLGVFLASAITPFFSASFAAFTIHPRYGKYLSIIPLILTLYAVTLILLNPPVFEVAQGGVVELVAHENTITAMWITFVVSLLAPFALVCYTVIVKGFENKAKGFLISASLFALSYLISYQENFGAGSILYVRRIIILLAILVLYLGFTMPKWLLVRLKTLKKWLP